MKIMHVFYDVHMAYQHGGLMDLWERKTKTVAPEKGEFAVFLNTKWTACKILAPDGVLLYWRSPFNQALTIEQLKTLPRVFQGQRLGFSGSLEAGMLSQFEKRHGKREGRLRVAGS